MKRSNVKFLNILIGSGRHAHALLGLARECGLHSFSCVSPSPPERNQLTNLPWLGSDDILEQTDTQNVRLFNGIGSTGSTSLRQKLFIKSRQLGFKFGSLVHPTTIAAQDVKFPDGTQIFPGVIIQAGVKISENVILNTGCIIEHDCEIGSHTHIAPGAVLSGGVKVGSGVHLGAGSVIKQGVQIGYNAVIGLGAVVLCDIPDNNIAVGNPARIIKNSF